MQHLIYSPHNNETVLYNPETCEATNVDTEFAHALIGYMQYEITSHGKFLNAVRYWYCRALAAIGIRRPEYTCVRTITDNNSGTSYRITMEITEGSYVDE